MPKEPLYLSAERGTNQNDMTPEEILSRAECFDPTPNREGIMRLALEMIVQQCESYEAGGYDLVTRIQRTAEQALEECA